MKQRLTKRATSLAALVAETRRELADLEAELPELRAEADATLATTAADETVSIAQ